MPMWYTYTGLLAVNRETLQKFLRGNYCRYKCRFTKFLSPNRLALKMKLMKTLLVLVVTVLTLCEPRHIRDWPQSVSSFPLLFIFFPAKTQRFVRGSWPGKSTQRKVRKLNEPAEERNFFFSNDQLYCSSRRVNGSY